MRVLTYNIHDCVGRDSILSPQRVLKVIRQVDADAVALQEVHDDPSNQEFLSALPHTQYNSIIYGETMRKAVGPYGNLLLTRHPTDSIERHNISVDRVEPRGAITASMRTESGVVKIVATHLGLMASERRQQWEQILRLCEQRERGEHSSILLGDVNEWLPVSRTLRAVRARATACSKLKTFPMRLPLFALDRIILFGKNAEVTFSIPDIPEARVASDHLPLVADIRF